MAHLRLHDLRHSAASEMINAKVDLHTVGAGLGHKSAASTKRYALLVTDAIKTALGLGQIGKEIPTKRGLHESHANPRQYLVGPP